MGARMHVSVGGAVCSYLCAHMHTRTHMRARAHTHTHAHARTHIYRDLHNHPITDDLRERTAEKLCEVRAGVQAQEGLLAFLEKRKPGYAAWPTTRHVGDGSGRKSGKEV